MNRAELIELIAERAAADPEFAALLAKRADWQIAQALSAGRTRLQSRQIGSGTILSTLQGRPGANLLRAMRRLAADDALIDEGIRLLDAGKWDVGAAESQKALDEFAAAGLMTQEACAALKALGTAPDAISTDEVSDALNGRA
jgi:hypothetical protein